MTKNNPILEVKNISKYFPGVQALTSVDLTLFPGEVHILAGENGAGKSTLTKCILGVYRPDEGEIFYRGEEISRQTTQQAMKRGIVAVYQELTMVPYLNAAENIFFNKEPVYAKTGLIRKREMEKKAKEFLAMLHCPDIDVRKPVKSLGVAEQQMIEIAKALSCNPQVLIFDEPTAALSDREVDSLFEQIRRLKKQGIAIVYISHRMDEFRRIGDRITILRDGKKIASHLMNEVTENQLIKEMVGREINEIYEERGHEIGSEILQTNHLFDRKGKVLDCSINVRRGEIVGIAGLVGAGRTELSRLIFGIDRPNRGSVTVDGKNLTGASPAKMVRAGVGLLPEDRKQLGLALRAPISWNITAASLRKIFPKLWMSEKKSRKISAEYIDQLKIATPDSEKIVGELSGGNQQKVVLAKWLLTDSKVLIFDEPTRGIDVGAKMEIYQLMHTLADQGKGILMISSEMPELMGMCNRLYVMREGRIIGELKREEYSAEAIGRLMMQEER